ncbi:MAG: carboxylating nicotinate-nucleotide diphosphorylase [Proteobacteria bacterium]|nr:carboxylating nicotinate-nucleotide diphosphorylase [Pseudomonadota bacterium]
MEKHINTLVRAALEEDVGSGDLTAALIPENARANALLISREDAVLCGKPWFDATFAAVDGSLDIRWFVEEGAKLKTEQPICEITGNARSILTAERTAINLLQTLSGTATITQRYVEQLQGLHTRLLDTRKTIPGMRLAQKYAAKTGGAVNHRVGLYDGVLIKENHIRAAGSIAAAVEKARLTTPAGVLLEVEVENQEEMQQAVEAGAKRILLDNFSLAQLRVAVSQKPGDVELEASGNVTLETLREIAQTGVDYISVGALTKHLRAVDFSLQFILTLKEH